MDRKCLLLVGSLVLWTLSSRSLAEEAPSPETVVDLNEGIYHYLAGQGSLASPGDPQRLTQAIEAMTSVLERAPNQESALLFRALAYGEMGLINLREKRDAANRVDRISRVLEARAGRTDLASLDRDIEQLEERLREYRDAPEVDEAAAAEWNVVRASLRELHDLRRMLDAVGDRPDEELESQRGESLAQVHTASTEEQGYYRRMVGDLEHLIRLMDRPEVAVRLLEVVANAKISRIDENTARDIVRGDLAAADAPGPVGALRDAAAHRLELAAKILKTMLGEGPAGAQRIRTKFFYGVILYRQAVPVRAATEPTDIGSRGRQRLAEAQAVMRGLADDPDTDRTWRSYAALYLGLILPFRAAGETSPTERDRVLDQAEEYLRLAVLLDVRTAARAAGEPKSDSGTIPWLVARQRKQITKLREQAVAAAPPINDLRLSVGIGAHRDTNVVLLGERTDLPRDISRERDFGFTFVTAFDYTRQLAEGLTFGFQGRVSQLWHADVDEFDEQTYGGTAALQYEAHRKEGDFGPVYLVLQYDYDYTLLGRTAFLESHAIRPRVRVFWSNRRAETEFHFQYRLRDYREPLFDRRYKRSGDYLSFGLFHEHKTINMTEVYENLNIEPWGHEGDDGLRQDDPDFPRRYLKPRISLGYSWDATAGDEFDRKGYTFGLGAGVPLPWGVDLDASAAFEWGEYARGSLIDFHRRPRRDFTQEYGIALSRTFVLREGQFANRFTPQFDRLLMTIRAHARWTHDDSNVVDRFGQGIFEYDRVLYGITVGFAFN